MSTRRNTGGHRDRVELNGLWRFLPDPHADGEDIGFWKDDFDALFWREVPVPSCFERGCPGIEFYKGICWYRRSFNLPFNRKNRRIVLRFEAVNYRAKVWLNGELIGENRDGFLPFEIEIKNKTLRDRDNKLVLCVDNEHHAGDVPGMHVGWRGYGGILREVSLYATEPLYIEYVRVSAAPVGRDGKMEFRLRVRNSQKAAVDPVCHVSVYDVNGKICTELVSPLEILACEESSEIILKGVLAGACAWSPETPVLYSSRIRLKVRDRITDEMSVRFGFRSIEATPGGLLLNGKQVFLTGFNRHEDSPQTAMAFDIDTTRNDIADMKKAGANFVRLCHYPHHQGELDICDEMGLLVFSEIPLYFWNDKEEGRQTNSDRVQSAARQMERMIARDFNHPSIIFWGISNETPENEPEVAQSNRELLTRMRPLDPTRLHVHVSCHWRTYPNFEEDDVICVNYYPSIDWKSRGHNPSTYDLQESADRMRRNLAELHQKYPSKPILVTEFGYCSFSGTRGHAFGEDEHARVIKSEFKVFDLSFICGAAIWCWADHPWPNGEFTYNFGGLIISPFGVVSRGRRKLEPYWTARDLFRDRQGLAVKENPPGREKNGSVVIIRPDMDGIPIFDFPDGFGIRPMKVEDIGLWTDIQLDAGQRAAVTDKTFMEEFGDYLDVVSQRFYIVTNPRGLGIGTVNAWYDRCFRGGDYGRIDWLAIRKSCRKNGIKKAMLSFALNQLDNWHTKCYATASCSCLDEICLYLDFGFEPDLSDLNARALWTDISIRLRHPLLEEALAER